MGSAAINISIKGLSPGDLTNLKALPEQIGNALSSAKGGLDSVRSGNAAGDPLSGLFSSISTLASGAGSLPSVDGLVGPIEDLVGQLPASTIGDLKKVGADVGGFLGMLGPLAEAISTGKLDDIFKEALAKALEFTGALGKGNSDFDRVQADLTEFFRLFQALLGWKDSAPQPEEVSDLLARALIGIQTDHLASVRAAVDAALGPLASLQISGADVELWKGLPASQLAFWKDIDARVSTAATVDWTALVSEISTARQTMLAAIAARDRAIALALSAAHTIRLPGISAISGALESVPSIPQLKLQPIFDGLRKQLQGMVNEFDRLTLTSDQMKNFADQAADFLLGKMEDSPLGQLRTLLVNFQQSLIAAIESLPFAGIAKEAHAALHKVRDAVAVLDPDKIRKPIHDFFSAIENGIDAIASNSVVDAIHAIWTQVEGVINGVTSKVKTLTDVLQNATEGIQEFSQHAGPALIGITEAVGALNVGLGAFDLKDAAQQSIANLHQIKEKVAKIDVSKLPEPAVAAVKAGADAIRGLDIAGAVNGPLTNALAAVDPTSALKSAGEALTPVVAQLKLLDPASIGGDLDKPVDELLSALTQFSPDGLKKAVDDALKPLRDAVNGIDFAKLMEPITTAFTEMEVKIDGILNPDPLFKPLEDIFKPVEDIIDAISPDKLIGLILPHGDSMGDAIGKNLQPPGAVSSAQGALKNAFAPAAEAQEDLFGFRPGDLLIPLIDLHRKLMETFDALSDTVLEPAARHLHDSLSKPLQDAHPDALIAKIQTSVDTLREVFDGASVSTRLLDAAGFYHSAAIKISAAARLQLSAGDAQLSVQVRGGLPDLDPLRLIPDATQSAALNGAIAQIHATLDLGELRSSYASFSRQLGEVLPGFLSAPELGANSLRDALKALDPTPIRVEINSIFDQMGKKLVAVEDVLFDGIEKFAIEFEDRLLPISLSQFSGFLQDLYDALKQQLLAFSPSSFKADFKLVFDLIKAQIAKLNPAFLVDEFNQLRKRVLDSIEHLIANILPDPKPFLEMENRLAALKPSKLLAGLVDALKPLTELVVKLDPKLLFDPLIATFAKVRADLPQVISDLQAALDEVLAAFPEGGVSGASVSVSASASASAG